MVLSATLLRVFIPRDGYEANVSWMSAGCHLAIAGGLTYGLKK